MLRVPTPDEYARLPYVERMRVYQALKRLQCQYAEYELQARAERQAAVES